MPSFKFYIDLWNKINRIFLEKFKQILRLIFSDFLISQVTSLFYGWSGNFKSWEAAVEKCTGYDDAKIINSVIETSRKVRDKEIQFERDSVPFDKIEYSFPLLAGLLWILSENKGKLNVLDFGGSLGTSYYQNRAFLRNSDIEDINWCIVEQPHFVNVGREEFEIEDLHFYYSIDECLQKHRIDVILLSSVIQYLENPYEFLDKIIKLGINYVLIDRTLFLEGKEDRLTIQKVPGKIYKANYCCWFLSEKKVLNCLLTEYELIYDFYINESVNIRSLYKGYFLRRKLK